MGAAGNLIDGTQGFRLDNSTSGGSRNAGGAAGDLNGDGYADIVLGAAALNSNDGEVFTYFGHQTSAQNPWPNPNYNLGGL